MSPKNSPPRVAAIAELERAAVHADAVLDGVAALAGAATVRELYETLFAVMKDERTFGASHAVVLEGDRGSDLLFVIATSAPELEGASFPRTERFDRVSSGQIVALKDATSSEEWGAHLSTLADTPRAVIHIPIRATTILVAMHPGEGHFTREHVMIASKLVPPTSQMLHRLVGSQQQIQRLRHDFERRVMREQFVLIKHAARALGAGVGVLDTQARLREASDALGDLVKEWGSASDWWEHSRKVLAETPIEGVSPIEKGGKIPASDLAKRTIDMDCPDGNRRVFELTFTGAAYRLEDGGVGHFILVADITRWVLAEDTLVLARDEAERANIAKSRFLANMSHELRTPLNAIIGYAEMLIEDARDDAPLEDPLPDLEKIFSSAQQLLRLINDVLDLSKIEAGKLSIDRDTFVLDALLDEVEHTIHPMIKAQDNRFVRTQLELPRELYSDRTKLRQILLNLLSNAAKFTEGGAITLSAYTKELDDEASIVFEVRDTGIGIPQDKIQRLFLAFEQVDPSITRRYGGTGLGLAICQRYSRMLGGGIEVESAKGKGSTFRVILPIIEPDGSRKGSAGFEQLS